MTPECLERDPAAAGWLGQGSFEAISMAVREARLRPEWAHLYPGLEVNVWTIAAQLVPLVLRHRLQDQPTWEFTRRILVDEHFEFRGGRNRDSSWSGILSRVEDA
jgi:hypothetical protein